MLSLNGAPILLKSLRVSVKQKFESEDASGMSSNTAEAQTGNKAKKISVSGFIPFTDNQAMTELFSLAQSITSDGERTIYRIDNATAKALGIKQCRFTEQITADEQESTRQWRVSFSLNEVNSVSEKIEQQAKANETDGANTVLAPSSLEPETAVNSTVQWMEELGGLDGVLSGQS